jgi:carboxypeptidase C (cathepsin A)
VRLTDPKTNPSINQRSDSSSAAAEDAWKAIQTFYAALPTLSNDIKSKTLNLATQSYGGHWGPVFFNHFRKQNLAETGSPQVKIDIGSLLVIDGLIDFKTQASAYPKFARNNTHGIELNETLLSYMESNLHMRSVGCLDQLGDCADYETSPGMIDDILCNNAVGFCRNGVEAVFGLRSPEQDVYDIRNHTLHPQPQGAWPPWLNIGEVQQSLGVDLNYSGSNSLDVYAYFTFTGDWVRSRPLLDLNELLDSGVRVALMYGDADYICNWLGGQDVSLTANFSGAANFRKAGYVPLVTGGKRYGDTREADNFSFTRLFDAGHDAPWYQPEAALALFNRTIHGLDIATGTEVVSAGFATVGDQESRYSQKNGDGPD